MIFLTQCFTSALNVFSSHYKFRDIDKDVLHFTLVWSGGCVEILERIPYIHQHCGCTFNLFHKCIPPCGLCGGGIWCWSDPADDETIDTADTEWWEWSEMMISQSFCVPIIIIISYAVLWIKLGPQTLMTLLTFLLCWFQPGNDNF